MRGVDRTEESGRDKKRAEIIAGVCESERASSVLVIGTSLCRNDCAGEPSLEGLVTDLAITELWTLTICHIDMNAFNLQTQSSPDLIPKCPSLRGTYKFSGGRERRKGGRRYTVLTTPNTHESSGVEEAKEGRNAALV